MKQRIISTVALIGFLAAAVAVFGAQAAVWFVALLTALTQFELYQLFEKTGLQPMRQLGVACGLVVMLGAYYLPGATAGDDLFVATFVFLTLFIIVRDLRAGRLRSFMPTLFGFIYIPYLLHFLVKILKSAEVAGYGSASGLFLALWVVAVAKASDIGGLLIGMRIGRTPLCPGLSPNKTFEGAIGGIVTSMVLGAVLALLFRGLSPPSFGLVAALLIPLPIAVTAIASDLVESAFKRQAGVKDSGSTIPGIGGVFDLTDSLVLSAPLGFVLFKVLVF